ncbi:helix-turn-helix domain-containing protein [Krasilnikovia sp. MM14-A1004]|uniref:helix-turn-helix domain-containing protein n=1 Tax=Krasilnikovia sp. MM14-A1004 TaxID=3373541 RepID=UPI00399CAF0B
MRPGALLTTGEAAVLLRSSRAHVVDLCLRGLLPYVRVGAERRIRRADLEALIRPGLGVEELRDLWLHRAVAGKLVANPDSVLAAALENLRRLCRVHPEGGARDWLDRWEVVLDQGVDAVLDALTSSARYAVDLRRTSPFAGALTEPERRAVLAAFAESRRDRARPMSAERREHVLQRV